MKPIDIKEVKNLNLDVHEAPIEFHFDMTTGPDDFLSVTKAFIPPQDYIQGVHIKGLDKGKDKLKEAEANQGLAELKVLIEG